MTDHFAANVHALVNATKGHGAAAPKPSDARYIRRLAEWVAVQRSIPFVDLTPTQLLAIDFADAILAWLDDPASGARTARFTSARRELLESLADPGD